MTTRTDAKRPRRRRRSANKMDKTVVVVVERLVQHPQVPQVRDAGATRYKAHDEKNECQVGDRSRIIETPPAVARHKRWRVLQRSLGSEAGASEARSRSRGDRHDPGGDAYSTSPTTPAPARSCASRCSAARKRQLRVARRHHRRLGEGSDPEREGEEGRRGEGGHRADREGSRPRRRLLHPLRQQLRRADRQRSASRSAPASSDRSRASCARRSS